MNNKLTLFTINFPYYFIRAVINFLASKGIERTKLLELIDTDADEINQSSRHYASHEYEKLLSYGARELGIKNIGFKFGKTFDISIWGLFGHIVTASPNLWKVLEYQKRYQCLLGNSGRAYHEKDGDRIILRWLSGMEASSNNIEHVISAWITFAFTHYQSDDKPISVHFNHSPLADVGEYEAFFGCPVFFNANFNGVIINESSLNIPIKSYNEEVMNVLCCHAENQLASLRSNVSLEIITQFIVETLPERVPELTDIANHLSISPRQVQRKFQKEGTNLTNLLEDIRISLATSYLSQTDHKLLYISLMLGYSEQSAFQRAFKRWTGLTPQSFRQTPMAIIKNGSPTQ
ncbi:conserved hypothetical protein [Alteromonas sp. 38]|uniref:AraC family transcriptional regulator n=1 Tax=Alteromonas TaxID=226 RepID=UPI0012F41E48|nr:MULTISPECIES: AraC family transcriptional regulator [Alteromonas]CAD5256112.1 conserved hypothetical protein [Alteromonas sp. 154]VXA94969.1 conserved hypothetical protein [Alteromonas sp. 38]